MTEADAVRLDKWLWAARFFKTRSLAQQAIRGGKVEINGAKPKASRLVRSGDQLQISKGELLFVVDVLQLSEKRVSTPLAQKMYCETDDSLARREGLRESRLERGKQGGRPDKHQRRALRRIQRGE
jgi:ribosome-associated heat shock protein Hsp15